MKRFVFVLCVILGCVATAYPQSAASPLVMPRKQFLDQSGRPLAYGHVCTYTVGSTTPQVTYTDFTAIVANATCDPVPTPPIGGIVLDAAGEASIYIKSTDSPYKVVVYDRFGVLQWSEDGVQYPSVLPLIIQGTCYAENAPITGNAGAKIAYCINALPASGGKVKADGFAGPPTIQTITQNVFAGVPATKPVSLEFGEAVFSINVTQSITASGTRIIGMGYDAQELGGAGTISKGTVFRWTGAANGTMFTATDISSLTFEDIAIDGSNLASIALSIGSAAAHPQFEHINRLRMVYMAVNGTDAALDLSGGLAFGVADSEFDGLIIAGGQTGIKINSQQLKFYGGAISGETAGVEMGSNAHAAFYGTGFYTPLSHATGETAIGIRTAVGIDGLELYDNWIEGVQSVLKRLDAGAAVAALRITLKAPRACISAEGFGVPRGVSFIDLTNLSSNVNMYGGFIDNACASTTATISATSHFNLYNLQAGAVTPSPDASHFTNYSGPGWQLATDSTVVVSPGCFYVAGTNLLTCAGGTGGTAWNNNANTTEMIGWPNNGAIRFGIGLAADSSGFKHKRTASCTPGNANLGTTCDTSVSWGTAFADTNYTASCIMTTPTNVPLILYIKTVAAGSLTVTHENHTAAVATGSVDCIAVHD